MRRVVVTGMGIVSSLGVGLDKNWDDLMAGKSGVTAVDNFDVSDLPAKIAGQVPKKETSPTACLTPTTGCLPRINGVWMISSSMAFVPPSRRLRIRLDYR